MIALLAAPSNLGLRPPRPGSVPGTVNAPDALRAAGLFGRMIAAGAVDAGVVRSDRYVDDDATRPLGHVRNEVALITHARLLADRISGLLDVGRTPLVIGGDCSILIGIGVALSRRGGAGLVHVDGHTDFRHPGNSDDCASVAGEDLAAAVGLHWPAIADIDGAGPYFESAHVAHIGHREDDTEALETRRTLGVVLSAREAMQQPTSTTTAAARRAAGTGYWLQVDVDVLDPSVMPAVDSPDPGGFSADALTALLTELAPGAIGASITVFDPDLDPDGRYAALVSDIVATGLARLGSETRHAGDC